MGTGVESINDIPNILLGACQVYPTHMKVSCLEGTSLEDNYIFRFPQSTKVTNYIRQNSFSFIEETFFQQTQGAVITGGQQTVVAGPVVTGTVPMGQQFTGVQYQTTPYQQG